MKAVQNITAVLLGLVLILWAYLEIKQKPATQKPAGHEQQTVQLEEEKEEEDTEAIVVANEPENIAPKTEEPQKAPEVDSDRLPDGIYYTCERITLVDEKGIKGIKAAQKVTKLREEGGKFIITDGKVELAANPWQLTDSKSYAEALMAKHRVETKLVVEGMPDGEMPDQSPVAPAPMEATPIKAPAPDPQIPRANPRIAQLDSLIQKNQEKIQELQQKMQVSSKTQAYGPIITRLRLEIENWEAEKRRLTP